MTAGDLDDNGQEDIVFDFGAGIGVWAWYNNESSGWSPVTGLDAQGAASGNLDGL